MVALTKVVAAPGCRYSYAESIDGTGLHLDLAVAPCNAGGAAGQPGLHGSPLPKGGWTPESHCAECTHPSRNPRGSSAVGAIVSAH